MQSGVPPVSPNDMLAWTPRRVLVYWTDKRGAVRGCAYDLDRNAGQWEASFDVAPPASARAGARVASVARSALRLELFWPTEAGAIQSRVWDQSAFRWGDARLVVPAGAVRADSSVVALSRTEDSVDLFWIGPTGAILTCQETNEAWGAPMSIAEAGAAGPGFGLSGVAPDAAHVHLFWSGADGTINGTSRDFADDAGRWSPAFNVGKGAQAQSSVAALATRPGRIDVFWAGSDGAVWSSGWDSAAGGKGPGAAQAITPPGAIAPASALNAAARLPLHIDVFFVGKAGEVAGTWWDAAANEGRWNAPFTVTPPAATVAGRPLAVAARAADHVDIVWRDPDGKMLATFWDAANVGTIWAPPVVIAPAS